MIKILIIIDNLNKAGAQKQVLEFISRYNREKFKITLCSLDLEANYMLADFKSRNIEVILIRQSGKFCPRTLVELYRLIKKNKFDIVHTYLSTADYYGRLAAIFAGGTKIVTSVRGQDLWKSRRHIWADRILHRFTDRIIINSDSLRNTLLKREKADARKIVTVYNGIDTNGRRGEIPKDGTASFFLVGTVGRLGPEKDYPTFLKAAREVLREISSTRFLIVGDGKLRAELENLAKELGIAGNVIFTGIRDDVPDILNSLDVFVLTSLYEGCPNVIMEAMLMKKPVIATDVGGCAELVSEGTSGYLTKTGDFMDIAGKIIKLLKDEELRMNLGTAGFTKIKDNFDSGIMAAKIEKVYEELVMSKVAFIMPQFPRYDETFILREILELENQGLNMIIFSLKTPRDKIVHKESEKFLNTVINLPFIFSFKLISANLYFLFFHPIRLISSLFFIITRYYKSPGYLAKALLVFPKILAFSRIAQKNNVGHIHGYWATTPCVCAMVISRLIRIPFSFTGHAHDIHLDTTGLREKIEKAKFVLTCTQDNKRHLLGIAGNQKSEIRNQKIEDKIIVSYHGLDLDKFKACGYRKFSRVTEDLRLNILSVGSLLECKGFDTLIEACKILKDEGVRFECIIAGGGPLEQELKRRTQDAGLNTHIKFTGYITQDKLIPLYQSADVFVLAMVPEIHWGIPNVLLEAMAAAKPVVCTQLPSIPELIEEAKTGFIVPAKDPAAIAAILKKLHQDRELAKTAGENGRLAVEERFDIKKNAFNMKKIFEGALIDLCLTETDIGKAKVNRNRECAGCNSFDNKTLIEAKALMDGKSVLACAKCGLIFLEGGNNGKFYSNESKSYWSAGAQQKIYNDTGVSYEFGREFENRIAKINSLLPEKGRLLDVGCGIGQFLAIAKKNGWNCLGLDVSSDALMYLKNELKIEGVCEELKECSLPDNYFDAVTMWDVLEHLENPVRDLEIIHRKLKQDGILCIKTPNEKSLFKVLGKFLYRISLGRVSFHLKYMYYAPHYFYYTPKNLSWLLERAGFKIVEFTLDETILNFAQAKIKKHYARFFSSKLIPFVLSPLYLGARLLRMQNKMVVYAKKIGDGK